MDRRISDSRHFVDEALTKQRDDQIFPILTLNHRLCHARQGLHEALSESPAGELTGDEELTDLVDERPGGSLVQGAKKDVEVLPQTLPDFVLAL